MGTMIVFWAAVLLALKTEELKVMLAPPEVAA
jgi:hypothetical protein